MKHAWLLLVIALLLAGNAGAQQPPGPGPDLLAPHVFPPDLVMRYAAEIGLDEKQRTAIKDSIVKLQTRFLDLQWDLQSESEKMARLLQATPVDETAVLAQADTVMGLEREVKRAQLSLLVRIKNVLSDAQRAKLAELRRAAEGSAVRPRE
jgi:Spy/CpxP family protein refolding chaperone